MECKKCNSPLLEEVKFCEKCGTSTNIKKEKFLSISPESVFGMRWIKTKRAKIITGIVMICFGIFSIIDPDLNDEILLIIILLVGGVWYLYKGFKKVD